MSSTVLVTQTPLPSESQRRAIEADPGALLVLAGPGAGKTFCLIERIRFLVDRHGVDPARVCAFTFTNKAAGEIEHRLEATLGAAAHQVRGGTIHAFCAQLLREYGTRVGLRPGFGIADEDYQISVLRRIEGPRPRPWHRGALTRFSAHRFRGQPLRHEDIVLLDGYERFLDRRNVLDFDTLIIRAAELLEDEEVVDEARRRWDVTLVDEFQDLNPVQYRVVKALASVHRHVFAVGDDEQSIYSWAGADPKVFLTFETDFSIGERIHLEENRRCPRRVFALARRLVTVNTPLFGHREVPRADRETAFEVRALSFATDDDEAAWLIDDIRSDRQAHGHRWGDVALLYRKHEIGERLESAFLNAGIPCRLAQGRALAEDPAVAYVIAAARVIANPRDDVARDEFVRAILPRTLCDEASAQPGLLGATLWERLTRLGTRLPSADDRVRQIRRARQNWRNLVALGRQHATLASLVQDLLSRKVGRAQSVLEERHDDISDPAADRSVVKLATLLRSARAEDREVWIAPMGGFDIPIKGMLTELGVRAVRGWPPPAGAASIAQDDVPALGLALGVFKAAQLVEMGDTAAGFGDFTAVDLETTTDDVSQAEIVEIAAVRVRDGSVVATFSSLVKPGNAISPAAAAAHGISDADVADAPAIAQVWPRFREFCGSDVIVAHNGYDFDFRILARVARELGQPFDLTTYDSLPIARELCPTSRKLGDLAQQFGVSLEKAHRALDDTRALAEVFLALDRLKLERARKTGLISLLDHLGVALALSDPADLCEEARIFRDLTVPFALSRYSSCLDFYEREQGEDLTIPTVEEVIERLGGAQRMVAIRRDRTADQRYPAAMRRLRRVISVIPDGPLVEQLSHFLDRAALSRMEGDESDDERVNLLTLHATKGLEFSRVYIVGTEDTQLPGSAPGSTAKQDELEEGRRLLYVGMTRTIDRLTLTRASTRGGKPTGGHRFLDEMELAPCPPE